MKFLHRENNALPPDFKKQTKSTITLKGVSAGYGAKTIVKNVSFSLGAGRIFALIGPNGAGKRNNLPFRRRY